jgi:hypothetical protein
MVVDNAPVGYATRGTVTGLNIAGAATTLAMGQLFDVDDQVGTIADGMLPVRAGGEYVIKRLDLDDIDLVNLTSPQDDDLLTYDSGQGGWVNKPSQPPVTPYVLAAISILPTAIECQAAFDSVPNVGNKIILESSLNGRVWSVCETPSGFFYERLTLAL